MNRCRWFKPDKILQIYRMGESRNFLVLQLFPFRYLLCLTSSYLPTVPISSGQSRFGDRKPDVPPDDPKKPIRPDFSRSTSKKHDFKPAFCLFSLFFSWNSSFFCVFWPFFMYPSVVGRYPNKKSVYIRALFWLKSSFFCHFPLNARNFVHIFI